MAQGTIFLEEPQAQKVWDCSVQGGQLPEWHFSGHECSANTTFIKNDKRNKHVQTTGERFAALVRALWHRIKARFAWRQ